MAAQPRTKPYLHQAREHEEHAGSKARALLWHMRTGKSKAIIDLAYANYDAGEIDAAIILAPNGVHRNWIRKELPAHRWYGVGQRAMAWSSEDSHESDWQERFRRLVQGGDGYMPWLTVNSESLHLDRVKKAVAAFCKGRRFLAVADEAHTFGRVKSKPTCAARAIFRRAAMRRIMTGTSTHNSPLRAYSQFDLLEHGALGFEKFGDFKAEYSVWKIEKMKSGRSFPALDHYQNLDELSRRIAEWSSLVAREDCPDMPQLIKSRRYFEPTKKQRDVYRRLVSEYLVELDGEFKAIEFVEGGAKQTKLQQVLSGWVKGDDGRIHDLVPPDGNPRTEALVAELEMARGKWIVWCQFTEDIERVSARLRQLGYGIVTYSGKVSDKKRDEALDRLQGDPAIDGLVGQPQAGGQGLDLSAASDIWWYSHTADNITRTQADERASAIGGRHVGLCDLAVAGSIDEHLLDEVLGQKVLNADRVTGAGLRRALEGMRI